MDTVFFIGIGILCLTIIIILIKMLWNRLNGEDEMEGLFVFKQKEKDHE